MSDYQQHPNFNLSVILERMNPLSFWLLLVILFNKKPPVSKHTIIIIVIHLIKTAISVQTITYDMFVIK